MIGSIKKPTLLFLSVAFFAGSCSITGQDFSVKEYNVMTYNIHHGAGLDGMMNVERIADIIRSNDADLVAIQEIDSMTNRSGNIDVLKEIGKLTNLNFYFVPTIDFDGGRYGIGILSKEEPAGIKHIELPGREEPRALLAADFEDFTFACTHLSLTREDRKTSFGIIRELVSDYNKPFILGGDFNSHPDELTSEAMADDFTFLSVTEEKSFPADLPAELLDYLVVNKPFQDNIEVIETNVVPDTIASDHRPVIVKLKLRKSSPAPIMQSCASDKTEQ